MNRNVESHFSMLPNADIQRSKFDRSQDIKFTFNVGELIPFYVDEVLPGDTFDITTSIVCRLQTLLTPVMDNLYLDTYYFFSRNQLVLDNWPKVMGESDKAWLPENTYTVPGIILADNSTTEGSGAVQVGDILDYMGVPVGVSTPYDGTNTGMFVNALPYRHYLKIYNDWFRDENLIDPVNIYTGDSSYAYWQSNIAYKKPFKAAKFHDYFTSALPSRAKTPNLGGSFSNGSVAAPVYGIGNRADVITGSSAHTAGGYSLYGDSLSSANSGRTGVHGASPYAITYVSGENISTTAGFDPTNLYASMPNTLMIGGVDIVSLRYAFQVQKFYEALARSGSRYIEIIEGLFNVNNPDQRIMRPEYLGGHRIPISIHQVTNQSQGEQDFLGDLGAMSLTTDKHSDFVKSFTEHGFVIGICVARYDHSYPQGMERFWFRKEKFDYYWPQFANLSEQPVYVHEIYADNSNSVSADVFGFQECYADYRYKPNRVAAEMRPGISNTLDSWHFADYYESRPYLSQEWIEEDKTNVDRTLAVTSSLANQLFADIYVQNWSTRPMPMYSIPGLADHH